MRGCLGDKLGACPTRSPPASRSSAPAFARRRRAFDLPGLLARRQALEKKQEHPDFWKDAAGAQKVVAELKEVKAVADPWSRLREEVEGIAELAEVAEGEADRAEVAGHVAALERQAERLEFQLMMSGEHDAKSAIVAIHPGAGGHESCDWAEMLFRMYLRWAERGGYKQEILELQPNDEGGIRSATFAVRGDHAYGYLRSELGVHRLVRISPFDAQKRRHTSFASVDVVPEFDDDLEIVVEENDLKVDTYRAGGAGGQHVNKTESAVRITHLPTGLVVACQSERSQHRNRAMAMKLLKAKLYRMQEAKRDEALRKVYGEKGEIAFGSQIRNYVLQPYQLVKDVRTGFEMGDVNRVLDGDLDPFIEAYLRRR
ncbi:MAG: peptide chain release factor 2 [Planctomycetota bacterium]